MNGIRTRLQMFVLGEKKKGFFPKEFFCRHGSTALLSVPYYLNFGKSLVANKHAMIFMSFLDNCKDNYNYK